MTLCKLNKLSFQLSEEVKEQKRKGEKWKRREGTWEEGGRKRDGGVLQHVTLSIDTYLKRCGNSCW